MIAGIVGKANVGKSTFFSAATMKMAKIAPYPFTTIEPNVGVAYVRVPCVCKELGVEDNPRNSKCIDGVRYVPVELIDVAGLVPDAWKGRGLGNKFLDELRRADALIHVVDAAGATDEEGRPVPPGTRDPVEDVKFLDRELAMWFYQILESGWDRLIKRVKMLREKELAVLQERFSGLSLSRHHVAEALRKAGLDQKSIDKWSDEDKVEFSWKLVEIGKPTVIAANKMDLPQAEENVKRLREEFEDRVVIPCSAEVELALRRAAEQGLIEYLPGASSFKILKKEQLTEKQLKALKRIEELLAKWGSTGVQDVIDAAYLKVLNLIPVFPVEDATKLTDHEGNVLPDVYLVPRGTTARELAYKIHTDLGESFLYAINVKTGERVGEDYVLKEGDIIKIVATKAIRTKAR